VIRKRSKKTRQHRIFVKANHQLRFPQVRVLAERGEMVGIMSTFEAMQKAREQELDLVLVTEKSNPPIVKIIELSKYKYQLQQKEAENRKKARNQDTKEIRFTPFMGKSDFEARLKKVIAFLEKGDKVKLSLIFKGRQNTKKEFGFEVFQKVFDKTEDLAEIEIRPKVMGNKLQAQLAPVKKLKKDEKK
jgi:translation initiation factor IF-3